MIRIIITITTIAFASVGIFFVIHSSHEEKMKCDEVVFLEGELSMDVREVDSHDNGISTIYLCDGKVLKVPTRRIIKIVKKEDVQ